METKPTSAKPKTEAKGAPQSIHSQAFWLYSTIVALAIREALLGSVPFLIDPPENPVFSRFDVICRLATFLIVTVRFYLGSAFFFDVVHTNESAEHKFPDRKYNIDFLFGFFHFLCFFGWAFSIDIHTKPPVLFPILLGIILVYDLIWLLVARKISTKKLIKMWAKANAETFVGALILYLIIQTYLSYSNYDYELTLAGAEKGAFLVVVAVSLIDIASLVSENKHLKKRIETAIN